MDKLKEARAKIDEIDSQIIELYEKRMDVVKDVTAYKLEHDMQILDSSRESAMLEKNLAKISNEEYKKYYENVLKGYLEASKKMQKEIIESKK